MINDKGATTCTCHNSFVVANKLSLGLALNPFLGQFTLSFIHMDTCHQCPWEVLNLIFIPSCTQPRADCMDHGGP